MKVTCTQGCVTRLDGGAFPMTKGKSYDVPDVIGERLVAGGLATAEKPKPAAKKPAAKPVPSENKDAGAAPENK